MFRLRLPHRLRRVAAAAAACAALLSGVAAGAAPAQAAPRDSGGYVPINGTGSSWAFNAVDQWRRDVEQYGMQVTYGDTGSSDGRHQFLAGTVDFAVSDIPFQTNPEDGSAPERPVAGSYAYMPIVAGGTSFMYHLHIRGQQVTNLRLSQPTLTKIFTGVIQYWDDPAVVADNPALALPHEKVVPVVRSDGSGSTAQFTLWMSKQQTALWDAYCPKVGRAGACGETSYYPASTGMIAQATDTNVAGYLTQNYAEGGIGYVNYSYALNAHYPVAKILNAAGYYTEPTPQNVAVSLLKAQINTDKNSPDYLTQQLDGVYADTDPRTYVLSSYSYMILPTRVQGIFSTDKGRTLGAFSYFFMCQGQQQSQSLGYSPLPINLVQAGFDQIRRIPGVQAQTINIKGCNNPTFSSDGTNRLATTAPMPSACDKIGATAQCADGSGGARGGSSGSTGGTGGTGGTSGGGTGGGGTGGTGGSGSTGGTGGPVNPDTGQSGSGSGSGGGGGAGNGGGGTTVLANPVSVSASSGWGDSQTLMALAAFTLLCLVLAPAATARLIQGPRRAAEKEDTR